MALSIMVCIRTCKSDPVNIHRSVHFDFTMLQLILWGLKRSAAPQLDLVVTEVGAEWASRRAFVSIGRL